MTSDATPMFLMTFGVLVFAQLAMDADGQLRMAAPDGAGLAAVVALVGGVIVATIWRVGRLLRRRPDSPTPRRRNDR